MELRRQSEAQLSQAQESLRKRGPRCPIRAEQLARASKDMSRAQENERRMLEECQASVSSATDSSRIRSSAGS